RLAMLGYCECRGDYYAAAKLYALARAADSTVDDELIRRCRQVFALEKQQPTGRLEELSTRRRYPLVRCAVLAGTGHAADAAELSEVDRAQLRKQALEWLRADLAQWSEV